MNKVGPVEKISAVQNQRLGQFLTDWCREHNMSAHRLCTLMRVSASTVQHITANDPELYPSYRVVQTIADWHNVSMDKLIGQREDVSMDVPTLITKEQRGTDLLVQAEMHKLLRGIMIVLEDIRSIMRTTWMDNKGD